MKIKPFVRLACVLMLSLQGCLGDKGSKGSTANETPTVYLDTYNRLTINGEPFFPIGLYWVPTSDMAEVASYGFNFVHPSIFEVKPNFYEENDTRITFKEFLDGASTHGLTSAFCFYPSEIEKLYNGTYSWSDLQVKIDEVKDHPALIANKIMDEPENYYYYEDGVHHFQFTMKSKGLLASCRTSLRYFYPQILYFTRISPMIPL